jgi:hypothetical protein
MGALQGLAWLAIGALFAWRLAHPYLAASSDTRVLEEHYRLKGFEPVSVRRVGVDWMMGQPRLTRAGAIRIYEIEVRRGDGEVERRVRGVSRSTFGTVQLWRRNAHDRWEMLR